MKKIIGLLLAVGIVCLFSVKVFAGMTEGLALQQAGNYAAAEAEFRKIMPTLMGEEPAIAQFRIAQCLSGAGEQDKAIAEFAKVKDIPGATAQYICGAQFYLANCYRLKLDFATAIVEFAKVKDIPGVESYDIASASFYTGICLESQKKYDEAQEMFKGIILIKCDVSLLQLAMAKIDFVNMTPVDADVLLSKAYRTVSDKQAKDKDGKLIYGEYLASLLSNMSQTAQANFIK